jgi:hypothetical protein
MNFNNKTLKNKFTMSTSKILGSLAVLVIAAMAAFNMMQNSNDAVLSDVALANVEALAEESSSYTCPGGNVECVRVSRGNEVHIFYKN